jgi:hypothetical protein
MRLQAGVKSIASQEDDPTNQQFKESALLQEQTIIFSDTSVRLLRLQ